MKIFTLFVAFTLICFALSPSAQAVVPAPDGGYPGFTTAEGQNALQLLTTGAGNSGLGWYSLFSDTTGSFNTAVGGGALTLNNADSNTAVGAAALLLNTTGTLNTATGTDALVFNDSGSQNTANGAFALFSNTEGADNTAIGASALQNNTTGDANTANGIEALSSNTTGNANTALGVSAGNGVTTADNVICIGANVNGANVSNTCFIGNISGVAVAGVPVVVAANGQLGVAPTGSPLSANELLKQQRIVQELKTRIALQEEQIKALTAGLQKV